VPVRVLDHQISAEGEAQQFPVVSALGTEAGQLADSAQSVGHCDFVATDGAKTTKTLKLTLVGKH
jgi:hypothetical protein